MKKKRIDLPRDEVKKMNCVKRSVLMIFWLICTSANISGQEISTKLLNFNFKNEPLSEAFKKVEKGSGYKFIFNYEDIKGYEVTHNIVNKNIKEVLNILVAGKTIYYDLKEENRIIIITNKITSSQKMRLISGSVIDIDKSPVVGATVHLIGTSVFASTDIDGKYSIQVPEKANAVLLFSYLGMKNQEKRIPASFTGINVAPVVLLQDSKVLREVVVTGIFTKKAAAFTGAAVTVTAEELQLNGSRNVLSTLRNIDPSFNIIENNIYGSNPNRTPEIQIRGNSSVPNVNELKDETRVGLNNPLVIIDGFQSTLQRVNDMNENEIESITILKDASATAIYGSRGANGVIVITTKLPKSGKLKLTYNGKMNIEGADLTGYNLLKSRDKLALEYQVGIYSHDRAELDLPLKRYYNFLLNEINSGVETDWLALPLQLGIGQKHNIKLEGGDQKFRYSASAQVNTVEGVMKGSKRDNFNGVINLAYTYNNLRFYNQLEIGLTNSAESPYGNFSDYAKMNPYWRPYDEDGNVIKLLGNPGTTDYTGVLSTLPRNPLYNARLNTYDKKEKTSIKNNLSIIWQIYKDLSLESKLGLTKGTTQRNRFRPAEHTAFADYADADYLRRGDYLFGITNENSYDIAFTLNYYKEIRKHSIALGMNYNMQEFKSNYSGFLAEGFTNQNFDYPSMALQYAQASKPSGNENHTRAVGFVSNLTYTYDNRYFADAVFREDGSSQFGSKKRFAPFWSTGIGCNLHNESFMKNIKHINRLKIRGSVGISGSQNFDAYQALTTYKYYTNDRYYGWNGAYLQGIGNENLTWQQKKSYNLGFETQLFNHRLSLSLDVYNSKTKNLVSSIDMVPSNGFSSFVENVGQMTNQGFEVKASYAIIRNTLKKMYWNINASAYKNKNKVVRISQALKNAQQTILNSGGTVPTQLYMEGTSSNTIWVVPSLGIDPSTGKEVFLDENNNPTFIWKSSYIRPCGTTEADLQGNFGTMFRYKGFTLNASFRFSYGGQVYNQTLINKVENANYKYNVDARVFTDRWQKPGDIAFFKALDITSTTQMTSRFVQDNNTLTCQNVNLQYDVKHPLLNKRLGVNSLILSAWMDDIFYLSTVKRERGTSYPFSRNYSLGISAIF